MAALVGTAVPGEPTERGGTAGCHVRSPTTCPRPNPALGSLPVMLHAAVCVHGARRCAGQWAPRRHTPTDLGSWRQDAAVPAEL